MAILVLFYLVYISRWNFGNDDTIYRANERHQLAILTEITVFSKHRGCRGKTIPTTSFIIHFNNSPQATQRGMIKSLLRQKNEKPQNNFSNFELLIFRSWLLILDKPGFALLVYSRKLWEIFVDHKRALSVWRFRKRYLSISSFHRTVYRRRSTDYCRSNL